MSEMMEVWNTVYKTDPKYTKDFKKGGGFSGTDINPTYRIMRMTELFGVCGKGWGWTVSEHWREESGGKEFVFVMVNLWWCENGKVEKNYTGENIGGTDATRSPDEAYKMAITDALGKCMTAIGISADVYMGEFDTKYQPKPAAKAKTPPAAKVDTSEIYRTIAELATGTHNDAITQYFVFKGALQPGEGLMRLSDKAKAALAARKDTVINDANTYVREQKEKE